MSFVNKAHNDDGVLCSSGIAGQTFGRLFAVFEMINISNVPHEMGAQNADGNCFIVQILLMMNCHCMFSLQLDPSKDAMCADLGLK